MAVEAFGCTIDPREDRQATARAYEIDIRRQLSLIAQVQTGQILFQAIRFWKKPILISPYNNEEGACNSTVENAGQRVEQPLRGRSTCEPSTNVDESGIANHGLIPASCLVCEPRDFDGGAEPQ